MKRTFDRITNALVFFLFIVGGFNRVAFPQSRHTRPARQPSANVLLITIDTVRADHLGCYGYSKIQTPTLDSLAHDGIVFERAISQVPLTWPSHTAILTGTYPFQNGVQDFTGRPLDPHYRSIAQAFKEHGYATGAVVSAYVLDRIWGLARGFEFYDDAFAPEQFETKDIGFVERRAGESVEDAIHWLTVWQKGTRRQPFFFWLHLYDPHSPYDPPEPFHSEYADHPYDGEIAYADHELGRVIAWLRANRLYNRTVIAMLSDHGESLGEHGESEHGFFIYNATTRVPLIVKPAAGTAFRPARVFMPVETTQVAPTILSLAGVKDEIQKQFASPVLSLRNENEDDKPAYSETFYTFSSFGWSPLHSLETRRYHYIDAPHPELYDESADPDEKTNLAAQEVATVAVFKEKLQSLLQRNAHKETTEGDKGMSPDVREKLRALGYVAYRSPVSSDALSQGLPDPKDKLAEFNAILEAEDAIRSGDASAGYAQLTKLEEQDRDLYILPFLLGEVASKRRDWTTSAAEFKKCLELNPNFDQAMTGLARALFFLGDKDEAKHWVENAMRVNPLNYKALYDIGTMEASTGDKPDAISDFERAVAIQGNFALLRRDLGMLYFEQQDYANARKHLAKAVELDINNAHLLNFLGICYDRTGELNRAIETYRHALQLDPTLAEAHLNLGFTYHRVGRETLSRAEYQRACQLNNALCKLVAPAHGDTN